MLLKGEKASLRKINEADLAKLAEWNADREISDLMGFNGTEVAMESVSNRNSVHMGIENEAGKLIGDIQLNEIAWRSREAELIVRIGEKDHWNLGYGADAIRGMLSMAFENFKLKRVYLRVCSENKRAIKCYEKCGFKTEGTVRRKRPTMDSENSDEMILVLMTISKERFSQLGNSYSEKLIS